MSELSTNGSKKYSVFLSQFFLKFSTSFLSFSLKVLAAPTPLSGLAINGNFNFFTPFSMSASFLTKNPGTTGTLAFSKYFFISDLCFVFFKSRSLSPKTLNCVRSAASNSIQCSF